VFSYDALIIGYLVEFYTSVVVVYAFSTFSLVDYCEPFYSDCWLMEMICPYARNAGGLFEAMIATSEADS